MSTRSRATELRYLRRILQNYSEQFLAISGMDFFHDHFFYKYVDGIIYFAEIDISGSFNGEFWKSLRCTLHVYYHPMKKKKKLPLHENGNLIPTYMHSRLHFSQERTLEQSEIRVIASNPALDYEKYFRKVWHIKDDESNVKDVLANIATVLCETGLPYVQQPLYSREAMLEFDKKYPGSTPIH